MDERMRSFIERLNFGQPYLLLGQQYLAETITDKFYEVVSERLGSNKKDCNIFLELDELSNNVEDTLQWLQTEADYVTLPDWGKYLSKIQWNGIITTSVDYFVEKMLRLEMREIQPTYQYGKGLPYNFKSKQILHISYLYGCLNQSMDEIKPPCSIFDFSTYTANASLLLNQIDREFLSPMGMFVIDGYDYDKDWMKDDVLFAVCKKLAKEQVFYFGFKDEYLQSKYIEKLVKDGIIVPIKDSLISILEEAETAGLLENYVENINTNDLIISIAGERRVFPRKKLRNISRTCKVLDDFRFEFDAISSSEEKELFRDFLYRSSMEPVWEAFYYGMNIVREYENIAFNDIIGILNSDSLFKKPIILYGQTGTGKSVALASLAYRIKVQKKYPVLFIDGKTTEPHREDIEQFCSWCDDVNVAIFWDASTHGNDISKYFDLNNYLASKGKKAVIIGTSYNLDEDIRNSYNALYVEAPIDIVSRAEINNFKQNYEKFAGKNLDDMWTSKYDNNFLVALYRMLPGTNYSIRKGLLREIDVDTIELSELVTLEDKNTPMMALLQKCGIPISSDEEQKISNKVSIGKIIKIVSMIGQYGIAIPFDVIFRMLSGDVSYFVGSLLEKIDFLHVETDMNGNINVFPRSSLEAQIVANSSLVQISEQVEIIKEVVENITEKELNFLVTLLKAIGPNGTVGDGEFKSYYKDIAETVGELRNNCGIYNASTILQEASYIREYFKNSDEKECDIQVLIETQELLLRELNNIEGKKDDFTLRNSYGQLLIELSSNIGAELTFYCEIGSNLNRILGVYHKLECYLEEALIYSPDPYYPVDIWAWSASNVLRTDIANDEKTNIVGKLVSLFENVVAENPEIKYREDYNKRILMVDSFESDEKITDEAFERLLAIKSDSGIYLRARNKLRGIDITQKIANADIGRVKETIKYLETEKFQSVVTESTKCLSLLLKLYWLVMAKEPLFFVEKKVLPFDRETWEKLYFLLERIEELVEEVSPQNKYLKGVCEFHLGKVNDCFNHFEEIRNNYYFGARRPILYYIASKVDEGGKVRGFSGQLKKVEKEKGRAKFYIPTIRKTLFYYNYDFVSRDLEENIEYGGIHIGFSFMGIRISDIE